MKHLIIFSIIIIGVVFLTLISWYDDSNKIIIGNSINTYLKKSKIGGKLGRGVFANKTFKKDDIIEKAPYIEDKTGNFSGLVRDYIFSKSDSTSVIAFGFASLYNHSDTPNALWKISNDYVEIIALNQIEKDSEILISYGETYWKTRKDLNKV
jgi:SET domain-containing protein